MYQHIIGNKRASVYLPQRSRNAFCSRGGRLKPLRAAAFSVPRPNTIKRSNFNANTGGIRVNVRFRHSHPDVPHTVKRSDASEDDVRESLLQIVAPGGRNLLDLLSQEIVIPGMIGI